ncbi:Crp/Fnr family transcriptional regulator [Thalassotalea insulae]|uniref:Crp/Fnr family transcriptional regulator n=1 Tax=Thalassotalea insulae TaxID=2056778 RepID=A0ABQ6GQP9_9GAMM|nr:Crp/Fnr family transcriptional regulator [Thalassotalea insulae]GLX77737.1 Crp/Fnr family transcriptional regulator [Thalassotalea insulae]
MNFNELAQRYGKVEVLKKKSYIFSQGEENQYIYIILEGVLKAYYLSAEGKECIKSFLFPGDTIGSLQALHGGGCNFSLLCLKKVKILKVPYKKVLSEAKTNIEVANSVIDILMLFAKKKEEREYELLCLSAAQRYQKLLEKKPDIYDVVTQNDIARYLGITPVALSRIKHQQSPSNTK